MIAYWTLIAAGVIGFVACLSNYCHAADRTDPEPVGNRVFFFWAACYFAGVFLMAAASLAGFGMAPPPSPLLVWLTLCGAGQCLTRALLLHVHRQRLERIRLRGPAAYGLWSKYGNRVAFGLILLAGAWGMTGSPGCAPVDANLTASQKQVVLAERSLQASFDAVDALLTFDDENRAYLREKFPAVHEFCEYLRGVGPIGDVPPPPGSEQVRRIVWANREAWRIHDQWAAKPTDENAASVDVWANRIGTWAAQARKYLAETR